jgi:hypothetical protein
MITFPDTLPPDLEYAQLLICVDDISFIYSLLAGTNAPRMMRRWPVEDQKCSGLHFAYRQLADTSLVRPM